MWHRVISSGDCEENAAIRIELTELKKLIKGKAARCDEKSDYIANATK